MTKNNAVVLDQYQVKTRDGEVLDIFARSIEYNNDVVFLFAGSNRDLVGVFHSPVYVINKALIEGS